MERKFKLIKVKRKKEKITYYVIGGLKSRFIIPFVYYKYRIQYWFRLYIYYIGISASNYKIKKYLKHKKCLKDK
jgi:hypothetical protein